MPFSLYYYLLHINNTLRQSCSIATVLGKSCIIVQRKTEHMSSAFKENSHLHLGVLDIKYLLVYINLLFRIRLFINNQISIHIPSFHVSYKNHKMLLLVFYAYCLNSVISLPSNKHIGHYIFKFNIMTHCYDCVSLEILIKIP